MTRLGFRLRLPAIPEAVPLARLAVGRLCAREGIAAELAEDVRLAVSEACTNCVRHAYGGGSERATFALDVCMRTDSLVVVVRDSGAGIVADNPGDLGLGLQLIRQVAERTDVASRPGRGTRVAMHFATG
jgi:serine/threonine-protein kinase RsbW